MSKIEFRNIKKSYVENKVINYFSNKIDSDNDASSVSIRFLIEEIIENEDSLNPLSDENIKEILKTKGINIARRTIAKYRNLLKIPSSSSRRKAQ